ncbi:MAG TPA: FG-GAP-like repeat-containing protein, partial [Tepidisphaeraceae bacterium]|nr:FG-GAP-like repeat-containing protein [Tepidisphaeraceae bacterium]
LLAAIAIVEGKIISVSHGGLLSVGGETRHLWPESQSPRAVVIGPFDEGNKTAVIVAFENSLSRFSLDGTRSDFARLTGEPLSTYLKDSGGEFKPGLKLIPLDANGDGRRDLLVLSEGANFLLINRGFGAFFISPGAAQNALGSAPDKPFPYAASATSSHWAAVDTRGDHHEDLLILAPDGALYRLGNPPPH